MTLDEITMRVNNSGLDNQTKVALLAIFEDLLKRVKQLEGA